MHRANNIDVYLFDISLRLGLHSNSQSTPYMICKYIKLLFTKMHVQKNCI